MWLGWKVDPDHSHVVNLAGSPLANFWQFVLVTKVSEEPYMYTHFSGKIFSKTPYMQVEQIYFKFCMIITTTTTTTRLYLDRVKTRITQSSFTRALLIKKRKERNEKEIISIMAYTHNLILMKSTIHANKNVCIYMHNTNIIKSDQ